MPVFSVYGSKKHKIKANNAQGAKIDNEFV